jgi:hypothetical protein
VATENKNWRKKKARYLLNSGLSFALAGYLVAWGGIEPPTQGFSMHAFVKKLAFMRVSAGFRVMCYRLCDRQTTLF